MSGTIPAVRERPKVAKHPTIMAPPIPAVKDRIRAAELPAFAGPIAAAMRERTRFTDHSTTIGATIPPVKDRPKVAKLPTILGPAMAAKKPLVQKAESREKPEDKQERQVNWRSWLPVAVGIGLGFVAPQIRSLAALWDPWGMRVVLPFVQLTGLHEIGMSDELTRTVPQLMLYLQFPLEGLLVASNLRRGMRFSAALGPIPALHFVVALVLWIVALGSARPI